MKCALPSSDSPPAKKLSLLLRFHTAWVLLSVSSAPFFVTVFVVDEITRLGDSAVALVRDDQPLRLAQSFRLRCDERSARSRRGLLHTQMSVVSEVEQAVHTPLSLEEAARGSHKTSAPAVLGTSGVPARDEHGRGARRRRGTDAARAARATASTKSCSDAARPAALTKWRGGSGRAARRRVSGEAAR